MLLTSIFSLNNNVFHAFNIISHHLRQDFVICICIQYERFQKLSYGKAGSDVLNITKRFTFKHLKKSNTRNISLTLYSNSAANKDMIS